MASSSHGVFRKTMDAKGRISLPNVIVRSFSRTLMLASNLVLYRDRATWERRGGKSCLVADVTVTQKNGRILIPEIFRSEFPGGIVILLVEDADAIQLWTTVQWKAHFDHAIAGRTRRRKK